MLRPALLLLLLAAITAGTAWSVFEAVAPPAPPAALEKPAVAHAPLTRHLLFVIVDGLRYDVATDPEQMPIFARAMREKTSAEIWCGRISMTSSAVMSYGTGQPGRLEQIVRNVQPKPPPYDSWLRHARQSGLTLMSVGDPAWMWMYGAELKESLVDPPGVAIDVDFNDQTFRDLRTLAKKKPNLLIGHFVTPDHQGHAYGILSERYRRHIHDFDRLLHELLAEFGPEWTVIVTSDHGATDTGTHGTDTSLQRRSPIYAYGPGIARIGPQQAKLDQNDVAGTLAALLGTAGPTHGVGHLLVDWLDVPPASAARIACADAKRAIDYGTALLGAPAMSDARRAAEPCQRSADPATQKAAARLGVEHVERAVRSATGLGSRPAWFVAALCVLLAAVVAVLMQGRAALAALPLALGLGAVALMLVLWVERLPGNWPNAVRALLYVLGNLALLWLLLRPARVTAWLARHARLAPFVTPGLLVMSYTTNTQVESYVTLAIGSLVLWLPARLEPTAPPLSRSAWLETLKRPSTLALLGCLLALAPAGFVQKQVHPNLFYKNPELALAAALVLVALWCFAHRRKGAPLFPVLVVLISIAASLVLRRVAPPLVGRLGIVAFAVAALLSLQRRSEDDGELLPLGFGLASYAWVSRDFEFLAVIPSLGVAELLARRAREHFFADALGLPELLLWVSVVFSLLYVQRIGVQGSLDIGAMDWGAGGFRDPNVPAWLVGSALTYKYLIAELLVVAVFVRAFSSSMRERFLKAVVITYLARTAMLIGMLFVCGSSFWTALRVLGDMPFAPMGAFAAGLTWLGLRAHERARVSVRDPALA